MHDPQYVCDERELAIRHAIYLFFQQMSAAGSIELGMEQDWRGTPCTSRVRSVLRNWRTRFITPLISFKLLFPLQKANQIFLRRMFMRNEHDQR
jgi:hypothetical protein